MTGYDTQGQCSVLLVELKQRSKAKAINKDAIFRIALGGNVRETVHAPYQAWSYPCLLEDFNEAVYSGGIQVQACAYLHNCITNVVFDAKQYDDYTSRPRCT